MFTQNSRYLFSGHGSGLVNMWDLEKIQPGQKPISVNNKFTIYALAINENSPIYPLLFMAGRYNKITVWNWNNKHSDELPYKWLDWEKERRKPVFGQQQYITSLATSGDILASADNSGYLTLWDIKEIRKCLIINSAIKQKNNQANIKNTQNKKQQNLAITFIPNSCSNAIIAQNKNGHNRQPIRSVALTQDGRYLATGGDDGKIMLWSLSRDKDSSTWLNSGKVVTKSDAKINSVDIKSLKDYLLVTSGDDNYKVKLYRISENEIK